MASLLGSPEMAGGASQERLDSVLGGMSPVQLFEVTAQMKALVQQNPAAARQVLVSQPHLTRALFQAQILLGMVRPVQQGGAGGGPGSQGGGPPMAAGGPPAAMPPVQYQGVHGAGGRCGSSSRVPRGLLCAPLSEIMMVLPLLFKLLIRLLRAAGP